MSRNAAFVSFGEQATRQAGSAALFGEQAERLGGQLTFRGKQQHGGAWVIELTKHWAPFGAAQAPLSQRARQKSAVFGPRTGWCHPLFGVGGNLHCQG